MTAAISYQLDISLAKPVCLTIGQLGVFDFPAGRYIYTGSAKRNMGARIARHLSHDKKLKWHRLPISLTVCLYYLRKKV